MNQFKSAIYGDGWLGIIFNGRNKDYGAYQLRHHSDEHLFRAFLISVVGFVALFLAPTAYKSLFPAKAADPIMSMRTVNLYTIKPLATVAPKALPKPAPAVSLKIETIKAAAQPQVVPDEKVELKAIESLKLNTPIGPVTQEGISAPTGTGSTMGSKEGVVGATSNGPGEVYNSAVVQNYPEFIGGMAAWAKFVQRNLRYPINAVNQNIQGKVYLSFVVEKDGSISDVTVLKGIGGGCDEEAVRVIKSSPRWKPGKQGNENVRVRYNMPIGFSLF